jgi:hypothetical protein
MQMQDGGSGLGGVDRLCRDLIRRVGSASDMVGVWIEPVIAQLMMILFVVAFTCPFAQLALYIIV